MSQPQSVQCFGYVSHQPNSASQPLPMMPAHSNHSIPNQPSLQMLTRLHPQQEKDRDRRRHVQGTQIPPKFLGKTARPSRLPAQRPSRPEMKTRRLISTTQQAGKGLVKVHGRPLSLIEPQTLRFKVYEPILILGPDKFGISSLAQPSNLRPNPSNPNHTGQNYVLMLVKQQT